MSEIIICRLSMEMEMAKEMGLIGKCKGCLFCEYIKPYGLVMCQKKGKIREQDDCEEWVVDHM